MTVEKMRPLTEDTSSIRWPDQQDGPWEIETRWRPVGGRPECVAVTLTRLDSAPVLASEVRAVPLAGIINAVRQSVGAPDAASYERLLSHAAKTLAVRRPGPGRPGLDGPALAAVARVYLSAWQAGEPPTKAVAEHFGISVSAAAKRVASARKAGLLGETTAGRPSGIPAAAAVAAVPDLFGTFSSRQTKQIPAGLPGDIGRCDEEMP